MTKLTASYERLSESPKGAVVVVVFAGRYLAGSEGNEFALQMVSFLDSVVAETKPAAVVFDLTNLEYVWGDAICGLAKPLFEPGIGFRPSVIVATERTARSLLPLLEPGFLLGAAGMKLFGSRHEAITHLERLLTQTTG